MGFNIPMAAYSIDLRKRIVDAVERGDKSKREIAKLFGVNESFVYKLLRQKQQRGDIAPLPHGGGAIAKLNDDQLKILSDLVAESPDLILEKLREQLKKKARVEVSIPTVWRALDALGISRKKRLSGPPKQTKLKGPSSNKSKKG
jgi:transposase